MKKYFLIVFLFFLSIDSFSQWTNEMTLPFSVQSQTKLNTFVDANGIHIVYWRNGGIKYALVRTNGTAIRYDRVIEPEGSGCDFANIVSIDNNYLYAVYKKNNTINVKRSINLGSSWSQYSYRLMTNSGCDKMVAYNDEGDIHIAWTENKPSYGINSYYIKFTPGTPPAWSFYKEVTDLSGTGSDPDIAISPNKIHYTYSKDNYGPSWGYPQSRDKIKTSPDWQNTMDISYLYVPIIKYKKPLIANGKVNSVLREFPCTFYGCNSFITYTDRPFDQGFWNAAVSVRETSLDSPLEVESTVDNKMHLLYFDKIDNQWQHRNISGTTLSDKIAEVPLIAYWSTSLVANSNDLYLAAIISESTPSNPKLQHYDVALLAPTGLTITEDANNHPRLNWNVSPEPDRYQYIVYRFDGYSGGSWQPLYQTGETNYTDLTLSYCHAVPPATCENYRNVSYRVTVVDYGSHESDPSNEVTARLTGGAPEKISINPESELPLEYSLAQNYPNPFNPTTTINYSLKTAGEVTLKVYDMLGIEVASIVNENQEAGNYSVTFNAAELPSGIYFCTLTSGNFTETKKLILLK